MYDYIKYTKSIFVYAYYIIYSGYTGWCKKGNRNGVCHIFHTKKTSGQTFGGCEVHFKQIVLDNIIIIHDLDNKEMSLLFRYLFSVPVCIYQITKYTPQSSFVLICVAFLLTCLIHIHTCNLF